MPFDGSKIETIAGKMRDILGPNGEFWCKDTYTDVRNGTPAVCLVGAYVTATRYGGDREKFSRALCKDADVEKACVEHAFLSLGKILEAAAGDNDCRYRSAFRTITIANDLPLTTFNDIRAALDALEEMELAAAP